jgi:hypothetical protein
MTQRAATTFGQVFDALNSLLLRLKALHQGEEKSLVWKLDRQFRHNQCWDYAQWLGGMAKCPEADPTPEAEPAVLAAIISALTPRPNYYPQFPEGRREELPQDQRQELEALRLEALRLAKNRQSELDGNSRSPARVTLDDDSLTVTLDGTPYKVPDPAAYAVYKAILQRDRPRITKAGIRGKVKGVKGQKTIPRLIETLPKALQDTVRWNTHGFWHELP